MTESWIQVVKKFFVRCRRTYVLIKSILSLKMKSVHIKVQFVSSKLHFSKYENSFLWNLKLQFKWHFSLKKSFNNANLTHIFLILNICYESSTRIQIFKKSFRPKNLVFKDYSEENVLRSWDLPNLLKSTYF